MFIKVQTVKREVFDTYDSEGRVTGTEVKTTKPKNEAVFIREDSVITVTITEQGAWLYLGGEASFLVEVQNPSLPFPENVRVN